MPGVNTVLKGFILILMKLFKTNAKTVANKFNTSLLIINLSLLG